MRDDEHATHTASAPTAIPSGWLHRLPATSSDVTTAPVSASSSVTRSSAPPVTHTPSSLTASPVTGVVTVKVSIVDGVAGVQAEDAARRGIAHPDDVAARADDDLLGTWRISRSSGQRNGVEISCVTGS